MRSALIYIFLGAFLYSCSKMEEEQDKSEQLYTISGTLFEDCSGIPVSNLDLRLFQAEIKNLAGKTIKGGVLANTSTDAEGRFIFQFYDKDGLYQQIDFFTGLSHSTIVDYLPSRTNLSNLVIYLHPTYSADIILEVKNSYSSTDTLFYTDANEAKHKYITGPFQNGLLYSAVNQKALNWRYPDASGVFQYWINHGNVIQYAYKAKVCDNTEIRVSIE